MELDGTTLFHHEGFRFALFRRQGGHAPELEDRDTRRWLGRFIGRALPVKSAMFDIESHRFQPLNLPGLGGLDRVRFRGQVAPFDPKRAEGLALPIEPSFYNFAFDSKLPYVYIGLALCVAVTSISYYIENSKLGYYLTAFKENEAAARALGPEISRQVSTP